LGLLAFGREIFQVLLYAQNVVFVGLLSHDVLLALNFERISYIDSVHLLNLAAHLDYLLHHLRPFQFSIVFCKNFALKGCKNCFLAESVVQLLYQHFVWRLCIDVIHKFLQSGVGFAAFLVSIVCQVADCLEGLVVLLHTEHFLFD
jgi:hypothetical protein